MLLRASPAKQWLQGAFKGNKSLQENPLDTACLHHSCRQAVNISTHAELSACAGLCFGGCEMLLRAGPAKQWLRGVFKGNENVKKNLDETVTQAVARIIGFLHLLVQVQQQQGWQGIRVIK